MGGKKWRNAPVHQELQLATSASRERIPSHLELMGQLRLYHRSGVSAAKIADTIGAKVGNVLAQLRQLQLAGWTRCEDDEPTAWSKWECIDTNPTPIARI